MIQGVHGCIFTAGMTSLTKPKAMKKFGYNISGGDNAKHEIDFIMDFYGYGVSEYDLNYSIYFTVMVDAEFECRKCIFKWSSHNATIKIDLRGCCISKKYRQKCKRCSGFWSLPCIKSDELKSVIEKIMEHVWDIRDAGHFIPFAIGTEPSSPDHRKEYCERCIELGEGCYLGGKKASKKQRRLDRSPVYSIFRQVPHVMALYIQNHLQPLNKVLEKMCFKIKVHKDEQCGFIHILPTPESKKIKDWNKICENELDEYLKGLDCQSLSIQPALLPGLQEIIEEVKSDPSLHVAEQTEYQITGKNEEVSKALEEIQQNKSKHKPCIIPF